MTEMIIKISIIMPTYNGAEFITKAIESVIAQTYKDWELLVIDDYSVDDTNKIVSGFLYDSRIKYFKNEKNLGIQKTLNIGLGRASGDFIARIDSDDEWIDINKLRNQISFLESNKDYVLLGTGIVAVNEFGKELMHYIPPQTDKQIRNHILGQNCFAHSSVMYRKNAVIDLGGYSEAKKARHIEDYDLWLKLGLVGKFANMDTYSVKLTIHSSSLTSKNRIIQAWRAFLVALNYSNKYPNTFSGLFTSLTRFVFFSFRKVVPIPKSLLFIIKKIVKEKSWTFSDKKNK
jgi:glycosyltransferase involved in cell wall biosynthesis